MRASLPRLLPDIRRAAGASAVVHGGVRREDRRLVLELRVDADAASSPLRVEGPDAAALFRAYRAAAPQWLSSFAHPGAAPDLPANAALAAGRGWLALDRDDAK